MGKLNVILMSLDHKDAVIMIYYSLNNCDAKKLVKKNKGCMM